MNSTGYGKLVSPNVVHFRTPSPVDFSADWGRGFEAVTAMAARVEFPDYTLTIRDTMTDDRRPLVELLRRPVGAISSGPLPKAAYSC